jgi:hypothetical protein
MFSQSNVGVLGSHDPVPVTFPWSVIENFATVSIEDELTQVTAVQ